MANPACCLPGCFAFPDCVIVETVNTIVRTLHEAGSVYCDLSEMSARDMRDELVKGTITNLTEALTGGILEPLLQLVRTDTETLYLAGRGLPPNVKEIIQHLVAPVYDGGITGFAYTDLDTVHIVPRRMPTAGIYLPDDKAAITLGNVVIVENALYDALVADANSGHTWQDFLSRSLDASFVDGVDTMIHELVHVKQYRVDGDHGFLTNYVFGTLTSGGYGNDEYEREAYTFTAQLCDRWGGAWCTARQAFHDQQITALSLGIPLLTCN